MKFETFLFSCFFIIHLSASIENDTLGIDDQSENLSELSLNDLLNKCIKYYDISPEANAIFKSKYGHLPVSIIHDIKNENRDIFVANASLHVGPEVAKQFLMIFGQSIESVFVEYTSTVPGRHNEIGKWVNTYCWETLKEFKVKSFEAGGLDDMRKPFKRVERVAIDGLWRIKINALSFSELFPEMRVLNLTGHFGNYILKHQCSNLVEFNTDSIPNKDLIKFIEMHPQLKKLQLATTSRELLAMVSDKLADLHVIGFTVPKDLTPHDDLSLYDDSITFEHVHEATIKESTWCKMQKSKIQFKQLKKLELNVNEKFDEVWLDFIGANKALIILTINGGDLNDTTLNELSMKIDSLNQVNIRCDSSVEVKTVAKFLRSNPSMSETVLNFSEGSKSFVDSLKRELRIDWDVTAVNDDFSKVNIIRLCSPSIDVDVEVPNVTADISNSTEFTPIPSTEVVAQNVSTSTNNLGNGASNTFSNIVKTITLLAFIINVIVL